MGYDIANDPQSGAQSLFNCLGSKVWVHQLLEQRPFLSLDDLNAKANHAYTQLSDQEILAAMAHHPRIGENIETLRQKFADTAASSQNEQALVLGAMDEVLCALRDANEQYFQRFGFVFLIDATGKTAPVILDSLIVRLKNTYAQELQQARFELQKIMLRRLAKL